MKTQPKQKLYKTAFSPVLGIYVRIIHAYQDSAGNWLFYIHNAEHGIGKPVIDSAHWTNYVARESELTNFVL